MSVTLLLLLLGTAKRPFGGQVIPASVAIIDAPTLLAWPRRLSTTSSQHRDLGGHEYTTRYAYCPRVGILSTSKL